MKLIHLPDAPLGSQLVCEPSTPAREAAIHAMQLWGSPVRLAEFAIAGHGYGCQDYSGITYPTDLDDFDRANGESIPADHVEVYAGYGNPHGPTYLLPLSEYLELLRQFLAIMGHPELSGKILRLTMKDA